MSVDVPPEKLAKVLQDYTFAYLITMSDEGRPHVVAVSPRLVDDAFAISDLGRRTRANIERHAAVTLVWPPAKPKGLSLILDTSATLTEEGLTAVPAGAVLHRPAPGH